MRLRPRPRLVDWSLLAAVALALATGLVSLVSGEPSEAWVFAAHGIVGLVAVVLLAWKLGRVYPRVLDPGAWRPSTAVSVLAAAAAVIALATGVYWVLGGKLRVVIAGTLAWNAMNVHILFGVLLVPLVLLHLASRYRPPRRADIEGRRTALQYLALVGGGIVAWRLQEALLSVLDTAGAARRFTGSREAGEDAGNTFPVTMWVADDPDPIDAGEWELHVGGAVGTERAFEHGDLEADGDTIRATLDCTSGWYTDQEWEGVRVGRLLDAAEPAADARWVSFRSVTGYRWSLPIEEARAALLATRVGGEPLTHGHGFPARLVAPGRRGFQWVKWVEEIEVRTAPDYGQWVAIFTSGFS